MALRLTENFGSLQANQLKRFPRKIYKLIDSASEILLEGLKIKSLKIIDHYQLSKRQKIVKLSNKMGYLFWGESVLSRYYYCTKI